MAVPPSVSQALDVPFVVPLIYPSLLYVKDMLVGQVYGAP